MNRSILLFLFTFLFWNFNSIPQSEKNYNVNLRNVLLKEFLQYVAKEEGLKLKIHGSIKGKISYNFSKIPLLKILDQVGDDKNFEYKIAKNELHIYKIESPSASEDTPTVSPGESGELGGQQEDGSEIISPHDPNKRLEVIKFLYVKAEEAVQKVNFLLKKGEKVMVDKDNNTVAILGSSGSIASVKQFASFFDVPPKQILIEAKIVEMSENIGRQFGVSLGELANQNAELEGKKISGIFNNGIPGDANALLGIKFGTISGSILSAKIAAAESEGKAQIISRPRVITLNNVAATITSGVTFHVKTAAPSGSAEGSPGGLTEVSAGLSLKVIPTVVGENSIKLEITVTNSEPDTSNTVDGIPGITDNTAITSLIVNSGETATMAGLIKTNHTDSRTGVPILRDLPILGWFFKNTLNSDRKNELMIFITPSILKDRKLGIKRASR